MHQNQFLMRPGSRGGDPLARIGHSRVHRAEFFAGDLESARERKREREREAFPLSLEQKKKKLSETDETRLEML